MRLLLILGTALVFGGPVRAADRITLDEFLAKAREQNLDLKIEEARTNALDANARGLAIPPPMIGYTKFTDQSGSSASGFEVSESMPFPSKIAYDREARKREAEAQEEAQQGKRAEILGKARLVYLNLWASQQRMGFLRERKGAIEAHLRLSRATVRSDSFLRIHQLRAESDLDLLENEILAAEQEERERAAEAAVFLGADPAAYNPQLATPPLVAISRAQPGLSHQVRAAQLGLESLKARESEAKASWLPDLTFRYKTVGQTQLMPRTSEVMVGINLPFLFPWDPAAASSKAAALRTQSELELDDRTRKVGAEISVLATRAASLRKQLENIQERLLPRAERRMKLVHNLAPRDMETLQDHREAMEAFPDLKLKALDLRLKYEETVAELAKFSEGSR